MKNCLIILCGLTIFFGCARIRTDVAPLDVTLMQTKPITGFQLTTGDIDRPYRELGVIFVKGRHVNYEKIVEELQSKAKELGADAVIKIKFGKRYGYSHRPSCQGVAVAFK
jgi:hypothetical protein